MKFVTTALLAFTTIVWAVSCSKDKDNELKISKIAGDYIMYEIELQSEDTVLKVPAANGSHGKIVVNLLNDSTVNTKVLLLNKDNTPHDSATFNNCKVSKDSDGDIMIYDNVGLVAYIYEGYDMDYYAVDNIRFGAKKK